MRGGGERKLGLDIACCFFYEISNCFMRVTRRWKEMSRSLRNGQEVKEGNKGGAENSEWKKKPLRTRNGGR